jgi:hypothetical protein
MERIKKIKYSKITLEKMTKMIIKIRYGKMAKEINIKIANKEDEKRARSKSITEKIKNRNDDQKRK